MGEDKITKANNFLKDFTIEPNVYLVGVFQKGITIFNQQIRSISIFHAIYLTNPKIINKDFSFAVIGGGIAGVTFAATALRSGIKVTLYEKMDEVLHLQNGCDRREIYPHLYNWPDNGSRILDAGLPILNWQKSSADDVAKQIFSEYQKIQNGFEHEINEFYTENLNCEKINEIKKLTDEDKFQIISTVKGKQDVGKFDVIIFAIGFGIENGVDTKGVLSYWSNEAKHQSHLSDKPEIANSIQKHFISGTGDGGLIDLLKLKIKGFSYDSMLQIMEKNDKFTFLKNTLALKKAKILSIATNPEVSGLANYNANLFEEFKQINYSTYAYIFRYLHDNQLIRHNRIIYLNGRKNNVEDIFDLSKASFLNLFLVFILNKEEQFIFIGGEFDKDEKSKKFKLKPYGKGLSLKDKDVIIRQGTNKMALFKQIPYFDDKTKVINDLKTLQESKNSSLFPTLWTNDEMIGIFNKETFYRSNKGKYIEHGLFDCLINILSYQINSYFNSSKAFRISLNKVYRHRNIFQYQQVTAFAGINNINEDLEGLGYVHDVDKGNVGFSIKSGQASILYLLESEYSNYDRIGETLGIENGKAKFNKRRNFLSVPILARATVYDNSNNCVSGDIANLVIYIDSPDRESIFNAELIKVIIPPINGFIETINTQVLSKKLTMQDPEYYPPFVNKDLDFPYSELTGFKAIALDNKLLKFDNFLSFDFL